MNSNQPFGRGGFDRGRGSFAPNRERTARPDFATIPDSIRQQFAQRQRPVQPQIPDQPRAADIPQVPNQSDSLVQQNRVETPQFNRNNFRGRGGFEGGDRQRGGFQQRRNVRLNTVYHFLAVFAAFTVVTIYIDKVLRVRRNKKKLKTIEVKN